MLAIQTRFIEADDGIGGKIVARCQTGRLTIFDVTGDREAEHKTAAIALMAKLKWAKPYDGGKWPGVVVGGKLPNKSGWAWMLLDPKEVLS